jgi:acetyl esterase/lipase
VVDMSFGGRTRPQRTCGARRLGTRAGLSLLVLPALCLSSSASAWAAKEKATSTPAGETTEAAAPAKTRVKQERPARLRAARERPAASERRQSSNAAGPFYERVSYGPKMNERANIWASATPNSTTVILIHGGGWRKQGALTALKKEAVALQAHGFSVFSINYQQARATKPAFPFEPNDVIMATQWAIAHAATYNANPANVVLVGGSAGGNLAALAAEQLDAAHPGTIRAVVSLSGPMNFETLIPMVQDGTIKNKNFITSIYQAIGGDEEEGFFEGEGDEGEEVPLTQALMREGSPVMHIPSQRSCPDWLLFSSEVDLVPLPQAQEMYSDLRAAGCKATLQVIPGNDHAFAYWDQASESVFSFIKAE